MNSEIHATIAKRALKSLQVGKSPNTADRLTLHFSVAFPFPGSRPSRPGESTNTTENTQNRKAIHMVATFQVHKQTYGRWPAKNGKPGGESFDLDLIEMSLPAEHAYRGTLPYRLSPDEKDKYWGKVERKSVQVAVHEIQTTQRGPVLRGVILSVNEK